MRWINQLYLFDTYRASDKPNAVSATTLLGPLFKIRQKIEGAETDPKLVDLKFKRSSMIGTSVHERAEKAFADDPNVIQEQYREREVIVDDIHYWVSGTCDLLQREEDGTYTITDWKTGYGKIRNQEALDKDAMQMSIYRWLLQDELTINDTAYSLFISQSNNEQEEYPSKLKDIQFVQEFIENRIWTAMTRDAVDCNDNTRYNTCTYCDIICQHRE